MIYSVSHDGGKSGALVRNRSATPRHLKRKRLWTA